MAGLSLGLRMKPANAAGSGSAGSGPTSTVTAIQSNGALGTDPNAASFVVGTLSVERDGFTALGVANRQTVTMKVRRRLYENWLNYVAPASTYVPPFSGNDVVLEDYIYATDTVTGASGAVTNSSTVVSPLAICNWAMVSRTVVGNSLSWQIVGGHREIGSFRSIACVEVWAVINGSTVATMKVSTMTKFADADQILVQGFEGTLDLTGATDNAEVTLHAKVYPVIGVTASIADTTAASGTEQIIFGPRYYYRSTARNATPMYCYISPTAIPVTLGGVASTNEATAEASPVPDLTTARTRLIAQCTADYGSASLDGCIIRLMSGLSGLSFPTLPATISGGCVIASIIFEKDPIISGNLSLTCTATGAMRWAAATGTIGSTLANSGMIIRNGITLVKSGAVAPITGSSGCVLDLQVVNCALDLQSNNSTATQAGRVKYFWCSFSNLSAASSGAIGVGNLFSMFRGCSGNLNAAVVNTQNVIGCNFTNAALRVNTTYDANNIIVAFNRISGATTGSSAMCQGSGLSAISKNCLYLNNTWEWVSTSGGSSVLISNDDLVYGTENVVQHGNTFIGEFEAGRANSCYDESPGDGTNTTSAANIATRRTHVLASIRNSIYPDIPMKGTRFVASNEAAPTRSSVRDGNYYQQHGVGMGSNCILMTYDDSPLDLGEGSVFTPGFNFSYTPSADVFEVYAGSTYVGTTVYTVGTPGGSNPRLKSSQPAISPRGIVARPHLPYTNDGTAHIGDAGAW